MDFKVGLLTLKLDCLDKCRDENGCLQCLWVNSYPMLAHVQTILCNQRTQLFFPSYHFDIQNRCLRCPTLHTLCYWGFITIFCHIFDINPYFCQNCVLFLTRTPDQGLFNDSFTIIALPFPYLVIYTLWPFMVWTKNTFLWIRKLYWMGHRTLNEPFEWSVVHPPVYCVIINYCLLTHLLLSPTPIVSTYCSIVMTTYNAQERVSFFLWNFLRSNNFLSIFRYLTKHTNSRFWKFTERKKLSHTKGYWA